MSEHEDTPFKRRGGNQPLFQAELSAAHAAAQREDSPDLPVKATVNIIHSHRAINTPLYKAPLLHPPPKSRAEGFPLTEGPVVNAGCGVCTVRTDEPILPTSAPVLPSAARQNGREGSFCSRERPMSAVSALT